jgi:RNA polymerase sigma factor (TIGR02999 family)
VAGNGDHRSLEDLLPLVYEELRALASRQLVREGDSATLQTTELVHEAYLRLANDARVARFGRAYFFSAASNAMRRILVDRARRRCAAKRGGAVHKALSLDEHSAAIDEFAGELVDFNAALERLASLHARQARVVECRYFGGLSVEETAEALGVSARTIKHDWAVARAWLNGALRVRTDG